MKGTSKRSVASNSANGRQPVQGGKTWEGTPPEVFHQIFVDGVDYDSQELNDLGWGSARAPFTRDTTVEDFHRQEQAFRRSQPEVRFGCWDSEECRAQAWWHLRFRRGFTEGLCHWDALMKTLGYRREGLNSEPVTLLWLLTCPETQFAAWRGRRKAHEQLLSRLRNWIDDQTTEVAEGLPAGLSLKELIEGRLSQLSGRDRKVLELRYGLNGDIPATLEEIGAGLRLTRERARQILTRIYDVLARGVEPLLARALLSMAIERTCESPRILRADQKRQVLKQLEPYEQILIDAVDEDLDEWLLAEVGVVHGDRFLLGFQAHDEQRSIASQVDNGELSCEVNLPMDVLRFKQLVPELRGASLEQIEGVLALSRRYSLERGFVLSATRPQAELDAIEVWHRIRDAGGYVSIRHLGSRPLQESGGRSADYLRRDRNACHNYKHLFMKICDDGMLALSLRNDLLAPRRPKLPTDPHPWRPSASSRTAAIEEQLQSLKIARLSELRLAVQHASSGSIPTGTTHALVSTRTDRFLRVTPGTYAIAGTDLKKWEERLVDEHQIQLYLEARRAGEPSDAYPSWTPSLELKWCRWARANRPDQYRELLHFCAISEWPEPDEGSAWWTDERDRLSRVPSSHQPSPSGAPGTIDFDELLEMMCMIALDGGINQQRINRSIGMRPEIGTEWAYLATLVAAGFLQDGQLWLNWHPVAADESLLDASQAVRGALLEERMRAGRVREDSSAARTFRAHATEGLMDGRCNWLKGSAREALTEELRRDTVSYVKGAVATRGTAAKGLDQMLLELEADAAFDLLNEDD